MCEVAANQVFRQDLGCTISPSGSPKGFLSSFRKKSRKFDDKSASPSSAKKSREEDNTAELIRQLQLDGRSDAEIATHLSFIQDVSPAPVSPKKKKSLWKLIKEEFSLQEVSYVYPEPASEVNLLTVSISAAPFYGALPPVMDMSYEEFATTEPVYMGTKCINNLPCCKHDGTPLPGNQTSCPVCLGSFEKGESLKSLPACVHFFHEQCIDTWLLVGHSCPVCKTLVQ